MNLIYTQSSGFVYGRFATRLIPSMKKYAEKVEAEFIYDRFEKKSKYPLFDKYKVGELLETYDRVLFLDCDILIHPQSPNVFELVPEGHFAAFNEGMACNLTELEARRDYLNRTAQAFEVDSNFDMHLGYFNCGVFLADKIHKDVFALPPEHPNMLEITSEQNLINLRIYQGKFKTFNLPIQFNAMPWRWTDDYLKENYFIHFAGMRPAIRETLIDESLKVFGNCSWT